MDGVPGHEDREPSKVRGGGDGRGSFSLAKLVRCSSSSPSPSQMIISYAGSVHVFKCMTAEMVQKIMLIAAAAEGAAAVPEATGTPSLASSTAEVDVSWSPPQPRKQQDQIATDASNLVVHEPPSDFPIARRNSLQRFLKKRGERLARRSPDHVTKMWENPSDRCTANEPLTPSSSFTDPVTP